MAGRALAMPPPAAPEPGPARAGSSTGRGGSSSPPELVLVSHRGPVQFEMVDGKRVVQRGGGGLVTALRDLVRHVDHTTWICAAATEEDGRVAAQRALVPVDIVPGNRCNVCMVAVDP